MIRVSLLAAIGALVWTGTASAHANLVRSDPADGAVLSHGPAAVRLFFDERVRPASGTLAIRNGDGAVLSGPAAASGPGGRVLVLPLRAGLPNGDYSVRWRVMSDDGHLIEGLLAFAVGAGRARPQAALAPLGTETGVVGTVSRSLFFFGVLACGGAFLFLPLTWRPALRTAGLAAEMEGRARRAGDAATTLIAVGGFLLVFLALGHQHGSTGTRFGRVNEVGALASVLGLFGAALGYYYLRLRPLAWASAAVLLVVPTLRGHALDPGEPRLLNAAVDTLHVTSVAVWLGGLLQLVILLPRAGRVLEPAERIQLSRALVRRFSLVALVAVMTLAATGFVRALFELSSLSQLWTTAYGRALLVKTGLLGGVLLLAWLNRYRLVPRIGSSTATEAGPLSRLRRNALAETLLLAGAVAAVAVLTDLRPGRQSARAAPRTAAQASKPAPPPRDSLVLAREDRDLAVALAVRADPGGLLLQATLLAPDNTGRDGARVNFGLRRGNVVTSILARTCGPGCYGAITPSIERPDSVVVRIAGAGRSSSEVVFPMPAQWPPPRAETLVRVAARRLVGLRSFVIRERLASNPENAIATRWEIVAPDRLSYSIRGGAAAVLVGARRWDRLPGQKWQFSSQSPLRLPASPWEEVRNARLLGTARLRGRPAWIVSFLDPRLPAWYTVAIDQATHRPLLERMTAASHFMTRRYESFNRPLRIEPPSSRSTTSR